MIWSVNSWNQWTIAADKKNLLKTLWGKHSATNLQPHLSNCCWKVAHVHTHILTGFVYILCYITTAERSSILERLQRLILGICVCLHAGVCVVGLMMLHVVLRVCAWWMVWCFVLVLFFPFKYTESFCS